MQNVQNLNLDEGQRISWPSPGCCIYCGRADVPLTDEHVVPYAIAGNAVIFEEASCEQCARTIQPFEQRVLRTTYGDLRLQLDTPTRNRKDRKSYITHSFRKLDSAGTIVGEVDFRASWDRSPIMCCSWRGGPPTILTGEPPAAHIEGERWVYQDHRLKKFLADAGRKIGHSGPLAYKIGDLCEKSFLRFVAKVAHGYAVATHGLDAFDYLTPDIILGKDPHIGHFVGGIWDIPPAEPGGSSFLIHFNIPDSETPFLLAKVRLFGLLGTPEQVVVVGRRRDA